MGVNNKKVLLLIGLALAVSQTVISQNYFWTGMAENNDFFDEVNWIDTLTGQYPAMGSIEPTNDIDLNLHLSCVVEANGIVQFGTGSLHIKNGTLSAQSISGGTITIAKDGYLNLSGDDPLLNNAQINFSDLLGWVKITTLTPADLQSNYLAQFSVGQVPANYPLTLRLDNYYEKGTIIRRHNVNTAPLLIHAQDSLKGNSQAISIETIQSGSAISNNIRSFLLKKGFMVTMAIKEDGTGKSKVFIASEKDLVVPVMPDLLAEGVSFIKVTPWNWVAKKGTGGDVAGLGNSWYYRWSNSHDSDIQREYAPMSWGKGGANDQSDIELYQSKYKTTHVMAFNEPDNCNDQSGQYGSMCVPDTAIIYYKNLMKTGLRLVSPGCREEAWNSWLSTFNQLAVQEDIRIDVIAVHWYDWGSSPANSPNANPERVFNRFRNYLTKVHDLYGLPIWITEFNANPNRTTSVNYEFMQLALPYLDTLRYVERYAWFQPSSGLADYYNAAADYTSVGLFYKNQESSPAIPEEIWGGANNLDNAFTGNIHTTECATYSVVTSTDEMVSGNLPSYIVFPNPAVNQLNIRSSRIPEEVIIYDLSGKMMKRRSRPEIIDISDLPRGLYLLEIDQSITKFIKI